MSADTATADPMEMTADNLWVAIYRDRVRGGAGYEFLISLPGEEGRALAYKDPSTFLALSLTELETTLETLAKATPLRAPGALNWVPIGIGRQVVWFYKDGKLGAQLVLARSADAAAEFVGSQGVQLSTTTDLSQVEAIITEMKEVLREKLYKKILVDVRPQEGGFGENWLEQKKDPILERVNVLTRAINAAAARGEKDPAGAQELLDILSEDGVAPPIEGFMECIDYHRSP